MTGFRPWQRALLFSLASNAAVLFVLKFGFWLWPERLPANSQNVFWLASGVNLAGLLILGLRYWPILLLNAFPAWWLAGEPLDLTALGSAANALEALLAAGIMRRWGKFDGMLARGRAVASLVAASLLAPLANTLIIPAYFVARGRMDWEEFWFALGNWNLSNGAAILFVTPLVLALWRGEWPGAGRRKHAAALTAAAVIISSLAFNGVFSGAGMNLAFLVFPVVVYAALWFGLAEMAAVLWIVLAAIYGSLAFHAHAIPPAQMSAAIWFVQAFCWVLAATGLLVAALAAERRIARERSLEASLREERARLDALRHQLNPHFLFNSLNSIYSTLPASGAEVPRNMLSQLAGYLRSTLAGREGDLLPLREEIRLAEQYLAIEKHRFGEDLRVSIAAGEDALDCAVPAFLLQPLVENAIVHGFSASSGVFRLEVRAAVRESRLAVEVANTGAWREDRAAGIGLENTRRRLALLYGSRASLEIEAREGWVRVRLELPHRLGEV